jgi:formylglycine-generating enzyme required for sulfatase activity
VKVLLPLSAGQIVNNHYRIETLLGQRGFGAVYRVWDTNLERLLALKENLDAFYIDIYEATIARYAACVSAGACQPPTQSNSYTRSSYYGDSQYANYPVIYVTWEMAKSHCEWRGGNLPSEAQREKAARGGLEGTDYTWGNEKPVCQKSAKNGANTDNCDVKDTEPVGSYSPNGCGLFDMAGNVWEWVWDWFSESYYRSQTSFDNPFGPGSGDYRDARGGAYDDPPTNLRVAIRNWYDPSNGYDDLGIRCSRSP